MAALRGHRRRVVAVALVAAAVWLASWATLTVVRLAAEQTPADRTLALVVLAATVALVAVVAVVLRRGGPHRAAYAVVAGVAVLLPVSAAASLRGTRWGYAGLSGDASFRTEAVTRHAASWPLTDYAYADLPAYYPPALSWLQGRTAALLDVEGWTVMQPFQLALAAVVPVLAWVFWRRVVPPLPAALVVATTALLTADLVKPDEWLVLMCAVPWWLDVVRGVRAEGVRAWPWWVHGIIGGLVLLTHTFYLMPLAVAALLGWAVDLVRRRPLALGPLRAAAIAALGVVVATPYWLPVLLARLDGAPTDNFQLRYTYPGANVPPWPLPTDSHGLLGAIGLLWIAWEASRWWRTRRRDPDAVGSPHVAGGVAVLLGGAYATMAAGGVGVGLGVGFLTFKTDELVILGLGTAGVLGLVRLARAVGPDAGPGGTAAALVATAALTLLVASDYVDHWIVGRNAAIARTTPYPDGSVPEAAAGRPPLAGPAFSAAGDPSSEELAETWRRLTGRPLDSGTVLVTTQVSLLATSTVHPFTTWKSIYSNPLGQFAPRIELLQRAAACEDSRCARDLLVDNPYDAVDGLVLERRDDELVLRVFVDGFPDRNQGLEIAFAQDLLSGPGFARADAGRIALVAVEPPA